MVTVDLSLSILVDHKFTGDYYALYLVPFHTPLVGSTRGIRCLMLYLCHIILQIETLYVYCTYAILFDLHNNNNNKWNQLHCFVDL